MRRLAFGVCSFLLLTIAGSSQNLPVVDSLNREIAKLQSARQDKTLSLSDSNQVNLFYELSTQYWESDLDSALRIAEKVVELSTNIGYQKGLANGYNGIGVVHWYRGDYPHALEYAQRALKVRLDAGLKKDVSKSYTNIGLIYDEQGYFPEALRYYFQALKIDEELNNQDAIARDYNNIGIIYYSQKNFKDALDYQTRALNIRLKTGDKRGLTESYSNVGLIHFDMQNYEEAFKNYEAAFKLREEIGDRAGIAISYNNFGAYYEQEKDYTKALDAYNRSLAINEEIGYKKSQSDVHHSIGNVYEVQGKLNEALSHQLVAMNIAKEIGALDYLQKIYERLAKLYAARGDYNNAYKYQGLYHTTSDSIFNQEKTKSLVRMQMQYEFNKEQLADSLKFAEAKREATVRLQRQRFYSIAGYASVAIVCGFLFVMFRQRNRIAKEKKRSDELLLNILPEETAEELKAKGYAEAKSFDSVTVMFTDFKNFTQASEKMNANALVGEINYVYSEFDKIITRHNVEKIKTIGDSYMCAGGLPTPNSTHAFDVVNAALEMNRFIETYKKQREAKEQIPFEIRIGIHTGCVIAGIVGIKKFAYDIWGDTVNTASRMESSGVPGHVNISGSTYKLVKDKFRCTHRGKIEAKHKGSIDMYFVEDDFENDAEKKRGAATVAPIG